MAEQAHTQGIAKKKYIGYHEEPDQVEKLDRAAKAEGFEQRTTFLRVNIRQLVNQILTRHEEKEAA